MNNGSFKLKKRIIWMSIVAFSTIMMMGIFSYSLQRQYSKINQMWLEVSKLDNYHTQALATVNQGFGYGGFIHHYKNYILRQQNEYLILAQTSLDLTYAGINDYLNIATYADSDATRQQMIIFKDTVDKYAQKLEQIHQLVMQGNSSEMIDTLVKVDDHEALQALDKLFSELSHSTRQAQSKANKLSHSARNTIFYGTLTVFLIITAVLLFLIRQSKQIASSYQQIKIILDAAPNAIIQANPEGKIVRFNKTALTLFGYTNDEFSSLSIEDLMPKQYREQHKFNREQFHETIDMNIRMSEFVALRKNEQSFPVSISLSVFSTPTESGSISIVKDLTEEKKLITQAKKDPLTLLDNRRSAEQFFVAAIQHNDRQTDVVSIILFDIDFFKHVNDDYGHLEGDRVLKKVADIMRFNVREADLVARWGSEEFLVICPATTKRTAYQVAEKLRKLIEETFAKDTIQITVSAGIASYEHHDQEYQSVLSRADDALYQSKNNGRNCVTIG